MIWADHPRIQLEALTAISAGPAPAAQQPVIVLIHGVGLRAEAWAAQMVGLAKHPLIAPDLPGHIQPIRTDGFQDLSGYTAAIRPLLDRPAILIGHSLGAMIALDLAFTNPGMARGVVALNAVHQRTNTAREAVRKRASSLDGTANPDPSATLDRWFGNASSPERDACERWLRTVDPAGYKAAYAAFAHAEGPSDDALANLRCPALFITGDGDLNSTPCMSRTMADLAPQGRSHVIAGAAHMMPMTHADAVNALLFDFLEATPS